MKRNSIYKIVTSLLLISAGLYTNAQNDDEATIKNIVETQDFVFKAQMVLPSGAASRQLEINYYDVKVSKKSLEVFLPYFGRAYSVTNYPSDGGINFNSAKFDYKITNGKKGGWDISIKPEDAVTIRELSFSISKTGFADLKVMSDNRQPISFYGYITKLE
jgi:hypothetical protein